MADAVLSFLCFVLVEIYVFDRFRQVELPKPPSHVVKKCARRGHRVSSASSSSDLQVALEESLLSLPLEFDTLDSSPRFYPSARRTFDQFTRDLQDIAHAHTIPYGKNLRLSEGEVFVGTVLGNAKQPRVRQDRMSSLRDQTTDLVHRTQQYIATEELEEIAQTSTPASLNQLKDWMLMGWGCFLYSQQLKMTGSSAFLFLLSHFLLS